MRLFVALSLPEAIRVELARAQAQLRHHRARWADVANLHLTLQFLGEADEGLVTPLNAALATVAVPPFRLALAGLGAFPNLRQPRVVWAGVAGDLQALAALQGAVTAATATFGFEPDRRPFKAHLTLGRTRPEAGPNELRALGEALARAAPPAPLDWEAGAPALFQSTLTPRGAIYTRLS